MRTLAVRALFLAIILASPNAHAAYPILDAVAGLPYPELITVYPDDSDPNLYYFVPTSLSFVYEQKSDGTQRPRLGVQYWGITGPDPDGAGANLAFSVQPTIDATKVKQVATQLTKANPHARYAFPTLVKSRMDVILNGQFVADNQDKSSPTSAAGGTVDATQGFAIGLTRIGARAFAQGVAPDSDVLAARYTYTFTGVAKRLHAKITIYDRRVYDHFKTSGSASAWYGMVQTSWAADWQKLTADGSIKLEYLQGGDTELDNYMLEVFKIIVNAKINGQGIFKPELQPGGANPAAPEARPFGWGFAASAAWEHTDETHNLVIEISKQKLEDRDFSIGLSFNAVCAKYPDSFADLTIVGNKCIDKNNFTALADGSQNCVLSKLKFLKTLQDQGLISQQTYDTRSAKVFDEPCYKDQTVSSAAIEAIPRAFEPIKTALELGRLTGPQADQAVGVWIDRPDSITKLLPSGPAPKAVAPKAIMSVTAPQ